MLLRRTRILHLILTLLLFVIAFFFISYTFLDNFNNSFISDNLSFTSPKLSSPRKQTQDSLLLVASSLSQSNRNISFQNVQAYIQQVAGVSVESQLTYQYIELLNRLKYTQMIAKERRLEINHLMKEIKRLWAIVNGSQAENATSSDANQERILLPKETNRFSEVLHFPSIFSLVPHLRFNYATNFDPSFRIAPSIFRRSTRFVFGIPTVKRDIESYLLSTLQNLIDNLTPIEKEQACFVVMVAETNLTFVRKIADDLQAVFSKEIEVGLIEIISPPPGLYFETNKLEMTLDDSIERVKWRSKQNLDFAYLMMYCQSKGIYYVQLEDDIVSKPSYLLKMESFIAKKSVSNPNWVVLDFCALGFIGKLFKSVSLSNFIVFFSMFFNDKPVDWLLDNYVQTKVCRFDKNIKDCKLKKDKVWIPHKPSLFQHVGTHSSLKGKIQKLRDKAFGKMKVYTPHYDNPPAIVQSTFKSYKKYSFNKAYEGSDYFWAPSPSPGDQLTVDFTRPTNLKMCLVRTGSYEHPEDIFFNASLLVKPNQSLSKVMKQKYVQNSQGFVLLDYFDPNRGLLQTNVPQELNPIKSVRIVSQQNSSHWILISEIYFQATPT